MKYMNAKDRWLTCRRGFGDFKQHCAGLHVSDLEPGEVDVVNVLLWATQIIWEGERKEVE